MKKIALLLTIGILYAFNVNAQKEGYSIKVKLKNSTDTACYLAYYFGSKKYVKDTAIVVKNNEFIFKGKEKLPGGIYIVYFSDQVNFEILVNEQNFSMEVDKTDILSGIKFKNSEENTLFYNYLNYATNLGKEIKPLQEALKKAQDNNNSDSVKLVTNQLQIIDGKIKTYRDNISKEHPNKLISKNFNALKEPEIPETPSSLDSLEALSFPYRYNKRHYWDYVDFTDDNILRTPIYESKLNKYFDKLILQTPDSLKKECDMVVERAKANDELFKFTVISLTNKYGKAKIMGLDEVFVHMVDNYYSTGQAFWLDSAGLFRLEDRVKTLKYTLIGRSAPNLTMKDTSDQYKVLYNDCYADFNIIVFWDPDCGHCKKEVPKWNDEYNKLKKEYSIHMIGITTSSLKNKWTKFIKDKELQEWQHLYDPDYKSPFRQLYDVTSTPKVYIIGKDKKLIAKQIGTEQIADFIKRKKHQMK